MASNEGSWLLVDSQDLPKELITSPSHDDGKSETTSNPWSKATSSVLKLSRFTKVNRSWMASLYPS